MYLHLGQDTVVRAQDIVGIFDMDNTTVSVSGRRFLAVAQKSGMVVDVTTELPKSFVITREKPAGGRNRGKGEIKVYISQMSTATLKKRADYIDSISL